jgi:uncharacterized membrane protein YjgN (DUF898 family)
MGHFGVTEFLLVFVIAFGITLIPIIFYLVTLQTTFNEVKPENRKMQPELVWLAIIPIFRLIWQFFIVNNLADSLKAEFAQRNINVGEERPGSSIGMAYCILNCCAVIPFLGFLAALAGFVCWIIYWVKVSGFKAKLLSSKPA